MIRVTVFDQVLPFDNLREPLMAPHQVGGFAAVERRRFQEMSTGTADHPDLRRLFDAGRADGRSPPPVGDRRIAAGGMGQEADAAAALVRGVRHRS